MYYICKQISDWNNLRKVMQQVAEEVENLKSRTAII